MKWIFCFFKDNRDESKVFNWIRDDLSIKEKQSLKRALEILSSRPISDWHKPNPSSKISNHIYVIRFVGDNRKQWRIFGFHDSQQQNFVMTHYGTEKDGQYIPDGSIISKKSEKFADLYFNDRGKHLYRISKVPNELSIATYPESFN